MRSTTLTFAQNLIRNELLNHLSTHFTFQRCNMSYTFYNNVLAFNFPFYYQLASGLYSIAHFLLGTSSFQQCILLEYFTARNNCNIKFLTQFCQSQYYSYRKKCNFARYTWSEVPNKQLKPHRYHNCRCVHLELITSYENISTIWCLS